MSYDSFQYKSWLMQREGMKARYKGMKKVQKKREWKGK